MPAAVGHHHRPTTKVTNKAFKSKAASKHELRDRAKGRVPNEKTHEKGHRKTPSQQVASKLARRNQAKQARLSKHREHLKETSVFQGKDGAPRIVAVIPLSPGGDAKAAVRALNSSVDIEDDIQDGPTVCQVDRFKQKLQYTALERDLTACLDAARTADYVVVVLSAVSEVDELGELILRSVESQGMSTLYTVVQDMEKVEQAKQKPGILGSLKSFISHFHPEQEKLYSLEQRQECANLVRSLCSTIPKGVRWRDERSWMLAESVQFAYNNDDSTVITGVVRGKGLKADRLVQVGDWGSFQIEKIVAAPLPKKGRKGEEVQSEEAKTLEEPTEDKDDLEELAPDDVIMDGEDDGAMSVAAPAKKGVLLDEHHYFRDEVLEEEEARRANLKLPAGTSEYQSAWYLEDALSDSDSDNEDMDMDDDDAEDEAAPEDGIEGIVQPEPTEGAPSEYPQEEAMDELAEDEEARQLAQYRARKVDEAQDDKDYPDEIELHPGVSARERLSRYRGLKSLRTSHWQEDEDRAHEPEDWRRLLQIPDYAASKSRSTREALVGGVAPGTRVQVYIKGIAPEMEKKYNPKSPVTLFSLLRHEHKKTAVNYLFNLSSDHTSSIKSKEELIVQCGPRRFVVNPVFSQSGSTPNDVHKYCRFLHPGASAIATFTGPVTWGAVPVLFFKRNSPETMAQSEEEPNIPLSLVGTGTALPPSTSRVIAKRVVLTGHPYHINKKVVTIRYMFFNRDDVEWFRALPLWTRRGRSGFFKEPLGTHGYFKAEFDGRINPQDSIGVSLYKRVFPKPAIPVQGPLLEIEESPAQAGGDVEMAW